MLLSCDFETTTDENDCRVWAWASIGIDDLNYYRCGTNLHTFIFYMQSLENNSILFFHNLKFDGEFIMNMLFKIGFTHVENKKELRSRTFTTLISDMGQFYTIEICFKKNKKIKIHDSLKLLPFSVDVIAKSFDLPISKLEIDYDKFREIGHILDETERKYLKHDVEIVARALKILFDQKLKKITTASNALHEYKKLIGENNFEKWFPPPEYDSLIRPAYKGGFTYLNPKYKNKIVKSGIVLDVNSLYPSVMYECPMPYDTPIHYDGKYKDDKLYNLYIQVITCNFEIKENHIPTLQIKNNRLQFLPTEYQTSSNGNDVTLVLSSVDLKLFFDHYNVYNIEYHEGWKFKSTTSLFKKYIDKWTKVKIEATKNGNKGLRTLAKLMLNSLYGKFALSTKVRSKIPYYDDGIVKYFTSEEKSREPLYVPVGIFVTAWARNKTIRSAQKVYDRFIYADTDSLHLEGLEIPNNLEIDSTELGKWKHEFTFSKAKYIRAKSYIEFGKDPTKDEKEYLKVTCAGMPEKLHSQVNFKNFCEGAIFHGKLQPKHVKGGLVLKPIDFTINK